MTIKTIIIADDHPLVRLALTKCLKQQFSACEIVEAQDFGSLQAAVTSHTDCDLLLLDLLMPGCHGFSGLLYITGEFGQMPVIIVSAIEEDYIVQQSLAFGARGFLPKSSPTETMVEACTHVMSGGLWFPNNVVADFNGGADSGDAAALNRIRQLTPQQLRVAVMLSSGKANKHIAAALNLAEATVKAHLTAIFRKLGVNSRTQAVLALKHLDVEK